MKRFLLFPILFLAGVVHAGDIAASFTFVDGSTYHASDFNNLISGAVIQPSFISGKSSATPVAADEFIFYQNGTSSLKQTTLTTLESTVAAAAPREVIIISDAAPTVNTDTTDAVTIKTQATAITSMTTNLSGTPNDFQQLMYRIHDNGTPRAITWGASFVSRGATLPTTTTASKVTYVLLIWNSSASTWDCVSTSTES